MKHAVILAGIVLAGCASTPSLTQGLLIEDVTIISPDRDAPLEGADVAIQDGRIVAIANNIAASPDVQRIDGRGRYLIPGLIDSHVHVGSVVALDDDAIDADPELLAAYRAQTPRAYLAFGFTSLVDLDLRPQTQAWFEETPDHPRLFHCGRALRIPGGYGAQRVAPETAAARFPNLIYEPSRAAQWPNTLQPGDHTPESAVARVADAGGVCVKTFIESGFGMFDWPTPLPETLAAIRTAATERDLTFVVHANSVESWRAALAARPDVIAHGLWHWPGPRMNAEPPAEARAVIAEVAAAGIHVQPTLQVLRNDAAVLDWSILDDPRMAFALPNSVLAYARSDQAQALRRATAEEYEAGARALGVDSGATALIENANDRVRATFRLLLEADAPLLFGSDTPSGEGIGNPPGLNGRLELQQWADAGAPLDLILRAATIDNARAFGLSDELGSVEVGKRADLLLLAANPLASIEAYDAIDIVFVDGQPIEREALRPAN